MSTATLSNFRLNPVWKYWWPILIGLLALYIPTYITLAEKFWTQEENAHGPIILMIVLWQIWKSRSYLADIDIKQKSNPILGSIFLLLGFFFYIVGRSQEIAIFEAGSQIPVLLGVLLITRGMSIAKRFWYPLLFLIFLIPLPGFVVQALTGPLKDQVSILVENALYWFGYPIARNGVILSIGPYQLMVADACSGLNSMFSLSALGLFYTYLVQRSDWAHNTILLASIIPIAFFANVIRVILLVLITYYFGDDVGQGFAHTASGLSLFMVALISFLMMDSLLSRVRKWQQKRKQ